MSRLLAIFAAVTCVAGVVQIATEDSWARGKIRALRIAAMSLPRYATKRYDHFLLAGARPENPTVVALGPDGRLYVAEREGLIHAYTLSKTAFRFRAVADERISVVRDLPNHDDLGRVQADVEGRLVTGLLATGTAENPVLYLTSSDPRLEHSKIDTNSGIVSRLERDGRSWRRVDLVRGLPRSNADHACHGLALDEERGLLYVAQGGNTNRGAPSEFFFDLPEYALAGAILEIELDALGPLPYDLPTLDDEDRPGTVDENDPFGGNDGKNQAVLPKDGPVRIYATGFRNPYDLVLTPFGMYVTDNGANEGFGGRPVTDERGRVTNRGTEGGRAMPNPVHHVTGPGYYAGHPNPTRANRGNRFNVRNPQSPVEVEDRREGIAVPPRKIDGVIAVYPRTTNGLATFDPGRRDKTRPDVLLAVGRAQSIQRMVLSRDGTRVVRRGPMVRNIGLFPLGIAAQDADAALYPGTIWVADYADGNIHVVQKHGPGPRTFSQRIFDLWEQARQRAAPMLSY
jgi:glucose/arabinose dehydrogenase